MLIDVCVKKTTHVYSCFLDSLFSLISLLALPLWPFNKMAFVGTDSDHFCAVVYSVVVNEVSFSLLLVVCDVIMCLFVLSRPFSIKVAEKTVAKMLCSSNNINLLVVQMRLESRGPKYWILSPDK